MALLPLRRKMCWGFFRPKNPTASARCKPANVGTSTLPLDHQSRLYFIFTLSIFPSMLHTHSFIYHQSNILLASERIINNTLLFLMLSDALPSVWHDTSILLYNPYSVAKAIKPLRHMVVRPYTGCNRRNVQDFGRVFLRSNYTDITQNTYIQSWMIPEILAREKCGLLWCLHTVLRPWRHTRHIRLTFNATIMHFSCIPTLSLTVSFHSDQMFAVYSGWKSVDNYDMCVSVFVVLFNGFMSLTSYFDVMYRY
jgi:hypothetical protein